MTDFNKALLDPTAVFKLPQDVVDCQDLNNTQKLEVLQRWEYDAKLVEIADDENMAGGAETDLLADIRAAQAKLVKSS